MQMSAGEVSKSTHLVGNWTINDYFSSLFRCYLIYQHIALSCKITKQTHYTQYFPNTLLIFNHIRSFNVGERNENTLKKINKYQTTLATVDL